MNLDHIRVPISLGVRFLLASRTMHVRRTTSSLDHFAQQNRGWQTVSSIGDDERHRVRRDGSSHCPCRSGAPLCRPRDKSSVLHQAISFRAAVLSAYRGRCAISRLPESKLPHDAHIAMDADELGPANRHKWTTAVENSPRLPQCQPDRHRPGFRSTSPRAARTARRPFRRTRAQAMVRALIQKSRRTEDYPDSERLRGINSSHARAPAGSKSWA